jgi:Lrp/AsnC family leucine-responsive transcriptional regulator
MEQAFDPVDRKLSLHKDSRAPHAAIAKAVGLSVPAIAERIRKLESSGLIKGYCAAVESALVGLPITAFVAISPQPRVPAIHLLEQFLALDKIEDLHAVAGTYGYIAKVRVPKPPGLNYFLYHLFMLDGVERTETTLVLWTTVERPMHLPFND